MGRFRLGVVTAVAAVGLAARVSAMHLDPTFGTGGEVVTFADNAGATALAVQADGKILALGTSGSSGIALIRYTHSGTLDPSFGDGGVAFRFGPPNSLFAYAMVLQGDGKILVAGSAVLGSSQSFFVARFLTNGDVDPSFGTGGLLTTDFPGGIAGASAIALQSDGRIVAAGGAGSPGPPANYDYAAARYNSDGSLDASFGFGGRVVVDMGGTVPEGVEAVVLEPDGRIILGGLSNSPSGNGFAVLGLVSDGSVDSAFGASGKVFLSVGVATECRALALQSDGKIVAAGSVSVPDSLLVVRMLPDGTLDPAFGTGGIATVPAPAQASGAALDPVGRIVLAGRPDFILARLLPNGQPDQSVGPEGWLSAHLDGGTQHHASANSLAVQRDGAILLGGDQEEVVFNALLVLRYLGASAAVPALSEGFALLLVVLLGAGGWVVLSNRT